MKHIVGMEVGWLGGTKVNIDDNKFQDFHTCYLAFKAGCVTMFVILMICKPHFQRKINTSQTNPKKEEESPILHQIMYQFFDCKICFSFLSSV
jgi:hypothetical protein